MFDDPHAGAAPRRPKVATRAIALMLATAWLVAALSGANAPAAIADVVPLTGPACGPVEYGGAGQPDVLIASDLPMQGASAGRSRQMVAAIRLALGDAGWRAGTRGVGYQPCDDSLAETGLWDADRCRANGSGYAANASVFAVVGTYNSGCAAAMLPILNAAAGGPVAMISPGNTLVCLTERAATCPAAEPASLYPSGVRNYVRVVPNDADQAAGLAAFARRTGVGRPYVLFAADDPTSRGQAEAFRGAARRAGIAAVGSESWNPEGSAHAFRALMRRVARRRPDGVILAGLTEQHGGALIRAKASVLGPNSGKVGLFALDGFAQQATIDEAGRAARGMYVSVPGRAPSTLTGAGRSLVRRLAAQFPTVELYAPYAAQAADVALDAIGRAGVGRSTVAPALFATRVRNGIIGTFSFTPSGDTTATAIAVFRARRSFRPAREVRPAPALVEAARG